MLRVAAADGQNTLLVIERDHRGGADFLAGLFAEEERQLVRAQYTANRLAAGQQAADRLLGFGVTDATAYRQRRFAEQDQADEGHLELVAQAFIRRADDFFQAAGIEQVEHQAAGLVEQADRMSVVTGKDRY